MSRIIDDKILEVRDNAAVRRAVDDWYDRSVLVRAVLPLDDAGRKEAARSISKEYTRPDDLTNYAYTSLPVLSSAGDKPIDRRVAWA